MPIGNGSRTNSRRVAQLLALVLLAVVTAFASASAATPKAHPAGGTNLQAVNARIATYSAVPKFTPPGPAFDARKAKGKRIFTVNEICSNPFDSQSVHDQIAVAKSIGVGVTNYCTQGQTSQWAQGVVEAVSQHVNLIQLFGADPRVLGPQAAQAKSAGIPFFSTHVFDTSAQKPSDVTDWFTVNFGLAGRLEADWAISDTKGNAHVLVIESREVANQAAIVNGIRDELAKYCGSCTATVVDVPITSWATSMSGTVSSALLKDPSINYVLPTVDPMIPFVLTGIASAGKLATVHVASYAGTAPAMKALAQNSAVRMIVAENIDWDAYAEMDQMLRVLSATRPLAHPFIPLRVFTKATVAQAGPNYTGGFGNTFAAGFDKLWGIKS